MDTAEKGKIIYTYSPSTFTRREKRTGICPTTA
jgi:hypothetical protein